MGAEITVEHGYIDATATRLKGARISIDMVTVTGTENLMMAASLAEGDDGARERRAEPEVRDLAEMLIAMGARIEGDGTDVIRIEGVDDAARGRPRASSPTGSRPAPSSCAAAATRGDVHAHAARAPTTSRR